MAFDGFFDSVALLLRGRERETSLSRRDLLSGITLAGIAAIAGSTFMMPTSAAAVELVDDLSDLDGDITLVRRRRRRRRRGRGRGRRGRRLRARRRRTVRPRRRIRRRPARPSVHFHFSPRRRYYSPRLRYGSRCDYWHQLCARNWGYGNPSYRGCLRYHGCW